MTEKRSLILVFLRVIIIFCVILGSLHLIMLGFTYQRKTAASQLQADQAILMENLGQLQEINQEQLDQANQELKSIQDENAVLEESFPEIGAPFAIYRRVEDLANQSSVHLDSVSIISSEYLDTVSGEVIRKQYGIEVNGSLEACLDFISALEDAGRDTVILDFMSIQPEENLCSIEVNTLGYTEAID